MKCKIKFKKGLPTDLRDLIQALLQVDANQRIPLIMVFDHEWVHRMQKKHKLKNMLKKEVFEKSVRLDQDKKQDILHQKKKPLKLH